MSRSSTSSCEPPACAIDEPRVRAVLDRLHREAGRQSLGIARLALAHLSDRLRLREPSLAEEVERLRNLYVPVTRKQGQLLYLIARSIAARRVVEYGTSFGVSTTYLAAAVRDNGGGIVIGTELQSAKIAVARRNLDEAGLGDCVEIREGAAHETLQNAGGIVDLVLLDGYLQMYVPILELLRPALRPGAVVIAVNTITFRRRLAPFIRYLRDPANGFMSVTLFVGDGLEYAVRL